jgi:putative oxidoreductase
MNSLFSLGERTLGLVKKLDWVALLVARLTVGVLFVSTGWGKVHNLEKVTSFFAELGIPMPGLNATVASYTELVCGSLLVIGLASRLASLPLVVTMIVAIVTAKRAEVHGLADLFGLVEWTYIAILLVIAAMGPGAASADAVVARRLSAGPTERENDSSLAYGRHTARS